jgi:predicted RNA-binding protein Jag
MPEPFAAPDRLDGERAAGELTRFLALALGSIGLELSYRIETLAPAPDDLEKVEMLVFFEGPDLDLLLERGGELLLALEYLAVRFLKLPPGGYDRVRFEAAGFRAGRIEELRLSARVAAERVLASRQPFRFQPMAARERRILHLTLREIAGVRSESEGAGDDRRVVVHPAAPARNA